MDGATIQDRIYAGRGKAALRIGLDCRLYRPLSAAAPLGNLVGTIKAAFNSGDSTYRSPNLPGDAIWYADFDGRTTQTGDYLQRLYDGNLWFIAAQQQMLPIVCIDCNRSVRVSRPTITAGMVGLQSYGSASPCDPSSMTDIIGSPGALWPASILLGGRSQKSGTGLPAAVNQSGWRIMLPVSLPVVLQAADIVTDELGRRYSVEAAEQSDTGWRLNTKEVHA